MSGSSLTRTLAAFALTTGSVVLPASIAVASQSPPNKAQIEYQERLAARSESNRSTKAQIEYEERMAQAQELARRQQAGSPAVTAPTPPAEDVPLGVLLAALGIGAATAAGSVLVVRHVRSEPRVG